MDYEPKKIPTAEEFLNCLRLSNENFWGSVDFRDTRPWLFRGQYNSEWALIPKSFRDNDYQKYLKARSVEDLALDMEYYGVSQEVDKAFSHDMLSKRSPERIERMKLNAYKLVFNAHTEFVYIYRFISNANALGQNVPGFNEFQSYADYFKKNYIKSHFGQGNRYIWANGAVALAQHHGIPTRLLDWTYDPLVAAYFAATKGDCTETPAYIAVVALRKEALDFEHLDSDFVRRNGSGINSVHAPTADNLYLHSQRGVFTYDASADYQYLKRGKYPTIEESLLRTSRSLNPAAPKQTDDLVKLYLPRTEAPRLLDLLKMEGISKASIMPSYDNIAAETLAHLRSL